MAEKLDPKEIVSFKELLMAIHIRENGKMDCQMGKVPKYYQAVEKKRIV